MQGCVTWYILPYLTYLIQPFPKVELLLQYYLVHNRKGISMRTLHAKVKLPLFSFCSKLCFVFVFLYRFVFCFCWKRCCLTILGIQTKHIQVILILGLGFILEPAIVITCMYLLDKLYHEFTFRSSTFLKYWIFFCKVTVENCFRLQALNYLV